MAVVPSAHVLDSSGLDINVSRGIGIGSNIDFGIGPDPKRVQPLVSFLSVIVLCVGRYPWRFKNYLYL